MSSKNGTYQCDDLTEEIFGHLCNVALTKCSDKFERKKAGCGGRAMRKRVLIKNFVSDLFKMHKKPPGSPEQPMVEDEDDEEEDGEEEYEDYEISSSEEVQYHHHHQPPTSYYEEEMEEVHIEDLSSQHGSSFSNGDCWLSQANMYRQEHPAYYEYPSTSAYDVNSSGGGPSTYSVYDVYSTVSEQANEGEIPSPSDPLASISSIMQPSTEPVYTDMYHHHHHPTNGEYFATSEDYFMNATEYGRAPNEPPQEDVETHQLTDLDATTRESIPMKRRITESFEEFNAQFHQKRIKI